MVHAAVRLPAFPDAVRLVTEKEAEKPTGAVIPEDEKPEHIKIKFYFLEAFSITKRRRDEKKNMTEFLSQNIL